MVSQVVAQQGSARPGDGPSRRKPAGALLRVDDLTRDSCGGPGR